MLSSFGKYISLNLRLNVVEILNSLKEVYSYKELENITGIPSSVLCRYVQGSIIPSIDNAERLWKILMGKKFIKQTINRFINLTSRHEPQITTLFSNPKFLTLISSYLTSRYAGMGVTKVVAPTGLSVSLATILSLKLNSTLIVVGEKSEFYRVNPKSFIKKNDNLLMVFDLLTRHKFNFILKELGRSVLESNTVGIACIVLVDSDLSKEIPSKVFLEYLIP